MEGFVSGAHISERAYFQSDFLFSKSQDVVGRRSRPPEDAKLKEREEVVSQRSRYLIKARFSKNVRYIFVIRDSLPLENKIFHRCIMQRLEDSLFKNNF